MSDSNNKPAFTFRDGLLQATIWRNTNDNGTFYTANLVRSYKPKDSEEWKETTQLTESDVLKGSNLLQRAYNKITDLKQQDQQQQP